LASVFDLSPTSIIVVFADYFHRSLYGFGGKVNDGRRAEEPRSKQNAAQPQVCSELMEQAVRKDQNVTIEWSLRQNVRANLRVIIKRILRKYGYPAGQTGESDGDRTGESRVAL
jgi:hypothetical protein